MTKKKTSCLFPDCFENAKSRGLCRNHYASAFRLQKQGKTSWEELEKAGKVLPSNRGSASGWFLEE